MHLHGDLQKNGGIREADVGCSETFRGCALHRGIKAVTSGNFSDVLVSWCSMAPLKLFSTASMAPSLALVVLQ